MCGIAGILNTDGTSVNAELLLRMRDSMWHRGPDDAGIHVDGSIGLAHRRLSILDLSPAGHQPMTNEDGTIWLVFNGEIYNYVDLSAQLRARGHTFSSHTDSEVILHLYEELGPACVRELQGMFAFAIWDSRQRTLFCARDRTGIKPFYYTWNGRTFAFGSEIKALLEHPETDARPSQRGIADYLFAGYTLADKTVFAGVSQLPPGQMITVRPDAFTVEPYWNLSYEYETNRSHADFAGELHGLLDEVVRLHCQSDAPLGCHLSGGLDSSTVAGYAARHRPGLDTFSIRFAEGGAFDESRYARAMAAHVGSRHWEDRPSADDLGSLFAALVWHMDMPMPSPGGFSYYTGARLARQHVTVALTGHGGDEVFGGYPAQFALAFGGTDMFAGTLPSEVNGRPTRLRRLMAMLRREGIAGVRRRLGSRLSATPDTDSYRWMRLHCDVPPDRNPALTGRFVSSLGGYSPVADYLDMFENAPTDQILDRCLHHDLRCYLPGLLHMEDRASMAVSLESRVPLLDHRLLEFMTRVPPHAKLPHRIPKELLRAAAAGVVAPPVLDRRDKGAFFVPSEHWFSGSLRPLVRELLLAPASLDRGVFNPDWLRTAVSSGSEIWSMVNLELWFRVFVDRDPLWLARCEQGLRAMSPDRPHVETMATGAAASAAGLSA